MIYRARAPRMVSRRLLLLSNVFSLSGLRRGQNVSDCRRLFSRATKHAATSPLSRVTVAAFLASEYATPSSPAGDHACVCVCFILCYRIPYTAYVVSPALAWRLYKVPTVSQSCE